MKLRIAKVLFGMNMGVFENKPRDTLYKEGIEHFTIENTTISFFILDI